tara:strand:+ start:939 stop:1598 length:660 start_codon:yes stop_codon:yes gene_type:complete
MNIFYIDFETTGLNPYHDHPIEVAIKRHGSKSNYQTLIKPPINGIHYKYISPKIQNITNISNELIEEGGIDPNFAIINIIKYIEDNSRDGDIYLIAHNGILFDFLLLKKMIQTYSTSLSLITKTRSKYINFDIINRIKYIDTLLISRMTLKNETSHNQNYLCKRYNIKNEQEHRAFGDIIALEKVFRCLTKDLSFLKGKNTNIYINNPEEIYNLMNFKV